jgi:ketosteroid isomerase-like protein
MSTTHGQTAAPSIGDDTLRLDDDPRSGRRRWLVPVVVTVIIALIAGIGITVSLLTGDSDGRAIADQVLEAWATGDQATIDSVFAEDVRAVADGQVVAVNRDQLSAEIKGAVAFGNTYRRVGPVSEYVATDGDLYVSYMVEVGGTGHPEGVPVVGFLRVRDGQVVRHVFMDAEHY